MMRILQFLVSLLLLVGLVYLLNNSYQIGEKPIPAFGKLLNPVSGFWRNAESVYTTPYTDLNFTNLQDEVSVAYDDRLVPHIFAKNNEDAYFVQGYITAQHRLFQLEISTRAASGRLSEVLGSKTIEFDKNKRRHGMVLGAERALETWKKDPKSFALLEKYSEGINAYISSLKEADLPIEYKLLNFKPEPWTTLKSAIFVKAMSETLASRQDDLEATNAMAVLGKEMFDFLYPEYFTEQTPIIPEEVKFDFTPISFSKSPTASDSLPKPDSTHIGMIPYEPIYKSEEGIGSNNWVVGPSKTLNHKPILSGDPHLNLTLPSIWFEIQMQTPQFNVYGASLPGLPGVIIGFNEYIAWSQTNVGHDVSDWYTIKWKNDQKQEYLLDGNYKKVDVKYEIIQVKGQEPIIDTVKYTYWGPIVYESKENKWADMALHWLAFEAYPQSDLKAIIELNQAKNFDEYSNALRSFACPAQNFVFACKNGDIGMRVQGLFPLKDKEQGRFVADGSLTTNGWKGYIPFEHNPFAKNPAQAYLASANQQSTSPAYPYYYNSEMFENYRGRVLNDYLRGMDSVTMNDMQQLQYNSLSLKAKEGLALLLQQLDTTQLDATQKKYYQSLRQWDARYLASKLEPVLFEIWFNTFYKSTWDEFSKDKYAVFLQPSTLRTIHLLRDDPVNKYFDVENTANLKETAKEVANLSFKLMSDSLSKLLTTNPDYNWTKHLGSRVNHIARIEPFSRKNIVTDGTASALNAQKEGTGPSWRMIVELGDTPKAWVVYPGGQSGNPGSPHYDDFIEKWAKGEQYEAVFMKQPEKGNRISFIQKFKKG